MCGVARTNRGKKVGRGGSQMERKVEEIENSSRAKV
jgi:hypothetical protein